MLFASELYNFYKVYVLFIGSIIASPTDSLGLSEAKGS